MKGQAIAAVAAALMSSTASAEYSVNVHWNYNGDNDPCHALDKKDCLDESFCVWTDKTRNMNMGKNERTNYGRHTAPLGKKAGSCAMIHVTDRVHLSSERKNQLQTKFGVGAGWDDTECNSAFWLKDCKDINQHHVASGSNKCQWTCADGCVDATGDAASSHFPYEHCRQCTPENESPPNRVMCNEACDVCILSANRDKYKEEGIIGGLVVMKGKEGDPWVKAFDSEDDGDTDAEIALVEEHREYFRGNDAWGVLMGDSDADGSDASFHETMCRTMGYEAYGMYDYSSTVGFDEDTNMSSYDGGPAWRLAGLHTGYLDTANPDSPEGSDGDYLGGHDYMDYLDYNHAAEFPWLKLDMDGGNSGEILFMSGTPLCPAVHGVPKHIHECDWASVDENEFEWNHYAQGIICCKKPKDCALDVDMDHLFSNHVFQPASNM